MASDGSKYHHGNLKRVLLDQALALIEEKGSYDFTMRELARRAEVTHGAPYRHFADKSTLLAGILAACQKQGSARTDFTAIELAIGAWSLAHGLSSLTLAGHLAKKPDAAIKISDQLADMLFQGILIQ